MAAYHFQDRIEEQSWNQHYQQLAREEKESELADDMEKGLPLRLLESLCIDELQRRGASKQAISAHSTMTWSSRNGWQLTSLHG
ncbi:Host-nuclease inhibitor protein Gam [Klebsiella grimontii]|nr:Host-nuclease inhibitor protein Gam [Klebsiella grimontii]